MTQWPRIGVVIPVFGHSKLMAEAVASALDQDYPGPIEIVIVVDGDRNPETLQVASSFVGVANRSVSAISAPTAACPRRAIPVFVIFWPGSTICSRSSFSMRTTG
jgi:glycosyltransferase involved in cell wall biosynthesis